MTTMPAPSAQAPWRARAQPLLGTLVEISAPASSDAELRRWTTPAFARIATIHAAMSFHSAGSDLARIARTPAGSVLQLQPDTWRTLALALALESASQGRFNCAVAPLLVQRGLLPRPAGACRPRAVSARAALTVLAHHQVRINTPVWIDLGGLAKGVAVDAAVQAMRAAGALAGVVNAGGDLRVFGGVGREVVLRHPQRPEQVMVVAVLQDGALATSTALHSTAPRDVVDDMTNDVPETASAPIVDPEAAPTGPASTPGAGAVSAVASCSVFAPSCALADGLTKVLAITLQRAAAAAVVGAGGPACTFGLNALLQRFEARGLCLDSQGGLHHV